jgi:hypothetical protein
MKKVALALLMMVGLACAADRDKKAVFESVQAKSDVTLQANPDSEFWRGTRPMMMQADIKGGPVGALKTEARSRWTKDNLYFLFVCPYQQLYLKPNPDATKETFELWNWNVAEVFLGSDFKDIKRYKEFEISPQNEWIDLDIDLHKPHHEEGWVWNSGFEHVAHIDEAKHVWYAALKIPFKALDSGSPSRGKVYRVNLFRTEGGPKDVKEILWQPTMSETFHVPEKFGLLKLVAK